MMTYIFIASNRRESNILPVLLKTTYLSTEILIGTKLYTKVKQTLRVMRQREKIMAKMISRNKKKSPLIRSNLVLLR
jgi:hypothetical protein